MDEHPSTQSFPNHHHHRHRPSFHSTLHSLQSPEAGYQPAPDPMEQYAGRADESTSSFLTSSTSNGERRGSGGGDRGFQITSGSSLNGDANMRDHLDTDMDSHFAEPWYGGGKNVMWGDSECRAADDFYSKGDSYSNANGVIYSMNCSGREGLRRKLSTNFSSQNQDNCDAGREAVYNRETNISPFTKLTTSHNRSDAGSFGESSVDYCRTDSRVSDNSLGREEDYGSGCGSGEDPFQPAEVEDPWFSLSSSSQTGARGWRGEADITPLAQGCPPQRSPITISSGTYTQKLDSFSEAFLSQRNRRFPVITSGDSTGQIWDFGAGRGESPGLVKSRHSCAFDSDACLASASFSSQAQPSLPSFPSPPTSSHIMSSVLSPPPTPLPPPSHSPTKIDSPSSYGGSGHLAPQEGESLGTLLLVSSRIQSLPSVQSSRMIWKFPLLSHCFPQSTGDPNSNDSNLRSPRGADYGNTTVHHDIIQSPESQFLTSTSQRSSLHPAPRAICPLNTPDLHLASPPSHLSGPHNETAEKTAPYSTQKVKNGPGTLYQLQQQDIPVYTGNPFPSILHSSKHHRRAHYTPRPLLNPVRKGTGLYSSLSSHHREEESKEFGEEEKECGVLQCVNVGPEFQAELPPCFVDSHRSEAWIPEEKSGSTWEQLLWKQWEDLEDSANLQNQVEKLLSLCSSSSLPGGGSNTELALHCLHYCKGNTVATLEMLLFRQPSPAGDYHYSGSDLWTDPEKSLFSAALGTYGKDFSVIQKMVRTKTVSQCIEFYYLSKRLQDKQKKHKEEENRDAEVEQQKPVTPICQPVDRRFGLAEMVPVPSLASFFPCKLCGKMFYKIKSRNAHMKIHRQPQEDWAERRLQHQLLSQRLALSCSTNLMPSSGSNLLPPHASTLAFSSSGLTGTSSNTSNANNTITCMNTITSTNASTRDPSTAVTYNNITATSSHVVSNIAINDSHQGEATSVLPFHQSWGSFGHGPNPAAFYCNTEGKEEVRVGRVGEKEPVNW